jgi:hypothetical protein
LLTCTYLAKRLRERSYTKTGSYPHEFLCRTICSACADYQPCKKGKEKGLSELKIDNNMCSSCLIFRQYNNYQCICMLIGLGLWCLTPLSTICQYIVAVSFIGGKTARVPREACQEIYFLFKLSITWPLSKRSRSHIIAYGKLTWYLV